MPTYTFSDLTDQRAFMRMWFARLFATTGNQMLMVAVGWQMYALTGSAWDLGLVGLYQFLPALLLTLVAGHVADRVRRGRIIALCLVAQACVAMVLMAATQGWSEAGFTTSWVSRDLLLGLSVLLGAARAAAVSAAESHERTWRLDHPTTLLRSRDSAPPYWGAKIRNAPIRGV